MSARNWGLLLLWALLWGSSVFVDKSWLRCCTGPGVLGRVGNRRRRDDPVLLAQGTVMPRSARLWARFLLLG